MSSTEPTPEAPTAAVTDGTMPLLRAARRQVVVDVLATAVIDLLLAEDERERGQKSDATY